MANKWGISIDSNWDLIDINNRKFIELKITENIESARRSYLRKSIGMEANSTLIVVNPTNGNTYWYPQLLRAQGEDKVTSFILSRCQVMRELGISYHGLHEEQDLKSAIFCNTKLNEGMNEWLNTFTSKFDLPPPINMESNESEESTLNPFDLKKMEEDLVDPLTINGDPIL